VGVAGEEQHAAQSLQVRVRDHLREKPLRESSASMLGENVDVRKIGERGLVGHDPRGRPLLVFPQLTTREREVLDLLAQGLDNAQIAAHLELSEKTVRNNITHIFDKIGVENRSKAIVLAREHGLGAARRE